MNAYLRAAAKHPGLKTQAKERLGKRKGRPTTGPGKDPKRARLDDGTFKADDPTTPDVNEAWLVEPPDNRDGKPNK